MSKTFITELDELIRARYTLLYVVTWEEVRARSLIARVAHAQEKPLWEWSITDGLRKVQSTKEKKKAAVPSSDRIRDVLAVLNEILQDDRPGIFILKDFHAYLEAPEVVRQLRDLEQTLKHTKKTIIILSPTVKVPQELYKSLTILDLPMPTYEELSELLNERILRPGAKRRFTVKLNDQEKDALIKAAQGLTLVEAENAFAKAIVRDNVLDFQDIEAIIAEKKQIIRKSGLLEYYDVEEDLSAVGGMELLKEWLNKRTRAFTEDARQYGLPQPRGMLLMGVQGCGKSLVAKTVSATWRLPLLRMDMSRIFSGYIGSSEENMRRALKMAESLAPIVLWVDEIDKTFSGVDGSGASDGGTTARVIGTYLTWMQEKTAPVFVIATANNVHGLPPELLRKGRLDEIFFIDLPRGRERAEIFQIHLKKLKRKPAQFDLKTLVKLTRGFSGAEIEQVIIDALHSSFFDNRELETADMVTACKAAVPLSKTMQEKIDGLRQWSRHRARPVSVVPPHQANRDSGISGDT